MYKPLTDKWSGRVDGDRIEQLRWHQVVEYIDLEKSEYLSKGFCILGFKSDEGIKRNKGRIGARLAPETVRSQLFSLPWHFGDVCLYDAGNVICDSELEKSQLILSEKVSDILNMELFPLIVGGGHEVAFGSIMGVYKAKGEMPAIVNFDAHFDMRDYYSGVTSGTSFRQIGDICKEKGEDFRYLCIGIQRSANTTELFNVAKAYKVGWIDIEMVRFNRSRAIKKLVEFLKDCNRIHLTICSDVFAQHISPGVSAPQPFGLELMEFLELFYPILKSGKLVSFDIAEVSPTLDVGNATSGLAANIIFKVVEGIVSNAF